MLGHRMVGNPLINPLENRICPNPFASKEAVPRERPYNQVSANSRHSLAAPQM